MGLYNPLCPGGASVFPCRFLFFEGNFILHCHWVSLHGVCCWCSRAMHRKVWINPYPDLYAGDQLTQLASSLVWKQDQGDLQVLTFLIAFLLGACVPGIPRTHPDNFPFGACVPGIPHTLLSCYTRLCVGCMCPSPQCKLEIEWRSKTHT